MKKTLFIAVCTAIVLFAACGGGTGKPGTTETEFQQAPQPTGKIMLISDIHFNPFYDVSIVKQLVAADYTQWEKIFEASGDSSRGFYGIDTYYPLLKSAFAAMVKTNAQPDMIIITGDFICHNFEDSFTTYTGITDTAILRSFIRKTVSFVASQISKQYPKTPILPVLGNNDDYCGDYHIEPDGPFLSYFARQWQPTLQNMPGSGNFITTFSKGGYYSITMPWDSTQVFIGLNSIFFSHHYENLCGANPTTDAGWQELDWLKNTLAACAAQNKKVWLAYHIAPGIDPYSSTHNHSGGSCQQDIVTMWHPSYNDSFLNIVKQYHKTIVANFAGHTHMDDFRVIEDNGTPISFVHITPAISPMFGNNPCFQEVSWNTKDMSLENNITYYFKGVQFPGTNQWSPEYDFNTTYGVQGLNAGNLAKIWGGIGADSSIRNKYLTFYPVDHSTSAPNPWKAYWCAIRNLTAKEFGDCYCTTAPTAKK